MNENVGEMLTFLLFVHFDHFVDTGHCNDGWVLYGSKCYLFEYKLKDRRNQDDAKKYCRQFGNGDLVSVHNK